MHTVFLDLDIPIWPIEQPVRALKVKQGQNRSTLILCKINPYAEFSLPIIVLFQSSRCKNKDIAVQKNVKALIYAWF